MVSALHEYEKISLTDPPHWLYRAATALDFAPVIEPHGPRAAITALSLRANSQHYLDQLPLNSDFKGVRRWRKSTHYVCERHFSVHGFTANPARSTPAQQHLAQQISSFLPAMTGRRELAEDLGHSFAQLAAGLNRAHLRFILRAERGIGEISFREDDGCAFSAVAQLRGNGVILARPGSLPPSTRREIPVRNDPAPAIVYDITPYALRQAQQTPPNSLTVWRECQPHSEPADPGALRLALFAYAKDDTPARPRMLLADCVRNKLSL